MNTEELQCMDCAEHYSVSDREQVFLRRMEVPIPKRCPSCRSKRRLAQVNQIHLFVRTCDGTGKRIISNFPADSPYQVYEQKYWYSDSYNGSSYGRDFDFNRPFFEQFHELSLQVPRPALFTDYLRDENCTYTNHAGKNKNCYLIFDSDECWDCYYSYGINKSRNAIDCYRCHKLELCYQTTDSNNCYNCFHCSQCENCSNSILLRNCIGCSNCIMCCNLRHKEYYYRNKAVSREEFEQLKRDFSSYLASQSAIEAFGELRHAFPEKALHGYQNENVSGNHLVYSKNAEFCFDSTQLWDAAYCYQMFIQAKDCRDCDECGEAECLYECGNVGYNAFNCRFSSYCLNQVSDLSYCAYCFNGCKNLFGCVGLKRKEYCILNREYPREEYHALSRRIIEHMKSTGEWGEFFPASTSPFPYNLSYAFELYPLSQDEIARDGLVWREEDRKEFGPATNTLPDCGGDISTAMSDDIFACNSCGRNYKLIAQEIQFYKKNYLSAPRQCFQCRHQERVLARTPRFLWDRNCGACGKSFRTAYSPERREKVLCSSCYLEKLD